MRLDQENNTATIVFTLNDERTEKDVFNSLPRPCDFQETDKFLDDNFPFVVIQGSSLPSVASESQFDDAIHQGARAIIALVKDDKELTEQTKKGLENLVKWSHTVCVVYHKNSLHGTTHKEFLKKITKDSNKLYAETSQNHTQGAAFEALKAIAASFVQNDLAAQKSAFLRACEMIVASIPDPFVEACLEFLHACSTPDGAKDARSVRNFDLIKDLVEGVTISKSHDGKPAKNDHGMLTDGDIKVVDYLAGRSGSEVFDADIYRAPLIKIRDRLLIQPPAQA